MFEERWNAISNLTKDMVIKNMFWNNLSNILKYESFSIKS